MRPAPRYRRACWASAYRFCVAQPCPRLHEAFHLERVTAQSGRQESGSHIANVRADGEGTRRTGIAELGGRSLLSFIRTV